MHRQRSLVERLIMIQALCRRFLASEEFKKQVSAQKSLRIQQSSKKPPIYKKPSILKQVVKIQAHIRGYLQRARFRPILIEKLLREQEEEYFSQMREVEEALTTDPIYSDLPLQPRSFSPTKNRNLTKSVVFDFDVYILAAVEIQRTCRGFLTRKRMCGGFYTLRKRVSSIQKLFRKWIKRRSGQVNLALTLIAKQTNILVSTFNSYQQLRSLILSQDINGSYSKFLHVCDSKLTQAGLYANNNEFSNLKMEYEQARKELERERIVFENKVETLRNIEKDLVTQCTRGIKDIKSHVENSHRTSMGHLTDIVKALALNKKLLDDHLSNSYYNL